MNNRWNNHRVKSFPARYKMLSDQSTLRTLFIESLPVFANAP